MEKPQVGDTVIIEGIVSSFSGSGANIHICTPGKSELGLLLVASARIKEVIPKPWEPKVGDKVRCDGHEYRFLGTFGELPHGKPEWAILGYVMGVPIIRDYHLVGQSRR